MGGNVNHSTVNAKVSMASSGMNVSIHNGFALFEKLRPSMKCGIKNTLLSGHTRL